VTIRVEADMLRGAISDGLGGADMSRGTGILGFPRPRRGRRRHTHGDVPPGRGTVVAAALPLSR
jgi:hypothetical protein